MDAAWSGENCHYTELKRSPLFQKYIIIDNTLGITGSGRGLHIDTQQEVAPILATCCPVIVILGTWNLLGTCGPAHHIGSLSQYFTQHCVNECISQEILFFCFFYENLILCYVMCY